MWGELIMANWPSYSGHIETKFLHIDSSLRAPLSGEWTPIVVLSNGKEKAISRGTLNQWMWDIPEDSPRMPELKKAVDAYDFATNSGKYGRA
jgi:hypothetical protein